MSPTIAPPVRPVRTASRSGTPGPDNATSPDRSGSRRLPDLAVALFAGVWLTASWERIGAPLGFSHDGQNAGVFGSAARRLVDDPFGSHLGSRLANGHGVYSNHPPLLNWLLGIRSTPSRLWCSSPMVTLSPNRRGLRPRWRFVER